MLKLGFVTVLKMRRPLLVTDDVSSSEKIVIVGGGLSGLCCAYRIAKKRPDTCISN